jgi:hypothetical protein
MENMNVSTVFFIFSKFQTMRDGLFSSLMLKDIGIKIMETTFSEIKTIHLQIN